MRESIDGRRDCIPEVIDGSGCDLFEDGLQLGEGVLDRVEIRSVGRQEAQAELWRKLGDDGLKKAAYRGG